jgi:hypothetical protein
LLKELGGEVRAAANVGDSIFGAGAVCVVALFEVPRVMQQDCKQSELKHRLGQDRLGAGLVTRAQQARHAQGSLQGVFEIMVTGIHGLIIPVTALEALDGPTKRHGHEQSIAGRKHGQARCLHLDLDGDRVFSNDRLEHCIRS